ncbi:MAG: hypothetical protein HYX57_11545 [Chloroflexi bacterium]|nr:hypothetical protein [Chloroflexota bacterium]
MIRPAACHAYDRVLTVFIAERDGASVPAAAFEHLEACDACATRLRELALTSMRLRRLAAFPVTEPSADALTRLRERVDRSRASAAALAWRWRVTLAGMATGTFVVAAIVAPLALHLPLGSARAEPTGYSPHEVDLQDRRVEESYLLAARSGTLAPLAAPATANSGAMFWRSPDRVSPVRKEVPSGSTGPAQTAD